MFGKNIKYIRESKNIGVNELSRLSGVNASYISALERDEKKNPSVAILEKLANALEVSIDEIMKTAPVSYDDLEKWNDNSNQVKEEVELYETGEFKTPEAAMQFILKQPKEEIIEFANELLKQLQLLGLKYKK